MKIQLRMINLVILVILTACAARSNPSVEPQITSTTSSVQEKTEAVVDTLAPAEVTAIPFETVGPNCLGDEVNPIGKSIAEEYEFVSYEQVMIWFCNGAEFEDILVALETESQTEIPADKMLKMLADGLTWEEIWENVGLID